LTMGQEFISKALTKWALDNRVRLHYANPGDKNENAYIESLNGRLRDGCLNMYWFLNLKDAWPIVEDWRIDYNERRPYTSLGGMTPSKFAGIKGLRLTGDSISFWKKIRGMHGVRRLFCASLRSSGGIRRTDSSYRTKLLLSY
jgi:hypothetical protein